MKVCIDIQSAIAQRAGVGRYTKSLVEHLGPAAGNDTLRLFYFDFKRNGSPFPTPTAQQRVVRWCPGRWAQGSWKWLDWPPFDWFAGPADVYHFPNFICPPLHRGACVVTIHDVAFLRYPETIEPRNYRYLTRKIHQTVERADMILTVSEFNRGELRELLGVPDDRLAVVWEGIAEHMVRPSDAEIQATRSHLGLDRPYLLNVSTLEPRKNQSFLIEVFERLAHYEGELIIAGMKGWKFEPVLERIRTSTCRDRIRYLEYVDERWLRGLYGGAELFVFPSLYEGFGFPPLEAMACGTPVVASSAGALPEVLGEAAVIIEDFDVATWASCVQRLLENKSQTTERVASGMQHVGRFTWEQAAVETWDVYRGLAGGSHGPTRKSPSSRVPPAHGV